MADGYSDTQFNNILQALERDLDDRVTPLLDQATNALEQLLQAARERINANAEDLRQVLEQAQTLSSQIRAELETLERTHTLASSHSETQLDASVAPLLELTQRAHAASNESADAATELGEACPAVSAAVTEVSAQLTDAGAKIQEQSETGTAQAQAALETLKGAAQALSSAATDHFAELAHSCERLTEQSTQLASALSDQTLEQLGSSAEQLRSGVHDAAQAAENAGALILDGLELFQDASQQMQRVFGEDSDEVMGTVRQIAALIESIKPFIDIAKSI